MNIFNFNFKKLIQPILCDYPLNYGKTFQDPGSESMMAIIDLYDNISFYLILILVVVIWFGISALTNNDFLENLHHGNTIEIIWTILPALILWVIGIPSLKLLYLMDEIIDPQLTVKAIANQWYWSYELSDYALENDKESIAFDSFKISENDLEYGELRNLAVDNYLVLPINTSIRLLVTSNDVIHSFAVPSLGVKCDALPGRLNSIGFIINRESIFTGQCSELCGSLHYGMPIGIKAVSLQNFLSYVSTYEY